MTRVIPVRSIAAALAFCFVLGGAVFGLARFGPRPRSDRAVDPGRGAGVTPESSTKRKLSEARVRAAEAKIVSLDVEAAEKLLQGLQGPLAARARARLDVYRGDCEGAVSRLSGAALESLDGAKELRSYAERCAGATVGAQVIEDQARGIWLRLQDSSDGVLAQLVMDTAFEAREAIERDLGTKLPRPLRIDLVRDLFSLSAVTSLPLDAAETTGTVAVARYGRVTMLSPRAPRQGYPWQDTLAHEITHLIVSRASFDRAPLWLQEGVAKREEKRWRAVRAFDDRDHPDPVAEAALTSGRLRGVDRLGSSIALLPSADAARIAFAEVTSFVGYWIERSGAPALPALLAEISILGDADRALRGVSGFNLAEWQILWHDSLRARKENLEAKAPPDAMESPASVARALRVGELLYHAGRYEESFERASVEIDRAPGSAALRFEGARAAERLGLLKEQRALLGSVAAVSWPHGGHLALLARESKASGELGRQALGLDPYLLEVACMEAPREAASKEDFPGPKDGEGISPLCAHVRSLVPRGSE